ncbi:P9 [Pseudomonas phage phi2954]|uniref:p9 n=1 Tax=Pseudomonas phage phi2954 TaxID=593131 RepID=C0KIU6_9VIRU|nr:P9 [Pseudomonas phage phi2954]ACM91131.1 P9 [Pseudomonas phage phi2954]
MFAKSVKVTLDRSGTEIKATKVEERTLIEGVGDAFTSIVNDDIAVGGLGVTVAMVGAIAGTAYGVNRVLTGRFNANPFSAG